MDRHREVNGCHDIGHAIARHSPMLMQQALPAQGVASGRARMYLHALGSCSQESCLGRNTAWLTPSRLPRHARLGSTAGCATLSRGSARYPPNSKQESPSVPDNEDDADAEGEDGCPENHDADENSDSDNEQGTLTIMASMLMALSMRERTDHDHAHHPEHDFSGGDG